MYLEQFEEKYFLEYFYTKVKPYYSAFVVDDINDVAGIKAMIFDYSFALMRDYLINHSIKKRGYYPYIVPYMFNDFEISKLYVWNKVGDDGFGLVLQSKKESEEFDVEYPTDVEFVIKGFICIDPNTLEVETTFKKQSKLEFHNEYIDAVIKEIYKAEQDYGLRYKELEYFNGSCSVDRFTTIMKPISGFGRYELIDGNIVPFCSKCSEEVINSLIQCSSAVIRTSKILNSSYIDIDGTGSTYLYVDRCIAKGKFKRVYINCYAGPQAIREYITHHSIMKWGAES